MPTFKPGDKIPETGIYQVVHGTHDRTHEALCEKGGVFPACNRCGGKVEFRLVYSAPLMSVDEDFQ